MPKTAVIYARFSCSKQREASIDDQLRVCRDWCRREGYAIAAEYCDYAISGRTDDRPEFQRMIANAGESDIALVYMMDRFSRGEYDAPIYKRELAKHGVKLVSALEAIPDSPEGIIYEKLLEGLAACESKKTAIRTRRGMEGNALRCKTNGVRIFGYRRNEDDEYEVDPDQAALVREAFERKINRETTNAIAADFAQRGVRTRSGNPCGYSMVHQMLHNRRYTGRYEWGGIVREGGMPQIVDEATFMRAQGVRGVKQRSTEDWGQPRGDSAALRHDGGRRVLRQLHSRILYSECGYQSGHCHCVYGSSPAGDRQAEPLHEPPLPARLKSAELIKNPPLLRERGIFCGLFRNPEQVAVGDEVGHAVEHQSLVDAVLGDIVGDGELVVAQIQQVDLREVG